MCQDRNITMSRDGWRLERLGDQLCALCILCGKFLSYFVLFVVGIFVWGRGFNVFGRFP